MRAVGGIVFLWPTLSCRENKGSVSSRTFVLSSILARADSRLWQALRDRFEKLTNFCLLACTMIIAFHSTHQYLLSLFCRLQGPSNHYQPQKGSKHSYENLSSSRNNHHIHAVVVSQHMLRLSRGLALATPANRRKGLADLFPEDTRVLIMPVILSLKLINYFFLFYSINQHFHDLLI